MPLAEKVGVIEDDVDTVFVTEGVSLLLDVVVTDTEYEGEVDDEDVYDFVALEVALLVLLAIVTEAEEESLLDGESVKPRILP